MAREVKIRANYKQDAGYLLRLARAVELDPKRSPAWKREIVSTLTSLSVKLLQSGTKGDEQ